MIHSPSIVIASLPYPPGFSCFCRLFGLHFDPSLNLSLDPLHVKTMGQAPALNYDLGVISGGNLGGIVIEGHDRLCSGGWILNKDWNRNICHLSATVHK